MKKIIERVLNGNSSNGQPYVATLFLECGHQIRRGEGHGGYGAYSAARTMKKAKCPICETGLNENGMPIKEVDDATNTYQTWEQKDGRYVSIGLDFTQDERVPKAMRGMTLVFRGQNAAQDRRARKALQKILETALTADGNA